MPRLLLHALTAAVLGGVFLVAGPAAAQAQPAGIEAALVEQGRYWQSRNTERATEAWEKLLRVQPAQAEALVSLGRLALTDKKPERARGYLAQLRKAHPGSTEAAQLEQEIALAAPAAQADLDAARLLLRERKIDQAANRYRDLFKGQSPQGRLGIEYYSVLGYVEGRRAEAIAGLERLLRDYPGDPQIRLAIANLRLAETNSRLPALQTLLELSKRQQDVGGEAGEQLRDALTWLGRPPPPAYVPIFRAYLAANPDDQEIRDQLNAKGAPRAAAQVDPVGRQIAAGYTALEAGDLTRAETAFQAALKLRARSGPALGGIGLVRLRQEQFGAARDYLARAAQIDGSSRWRSSLNSATYWALVNEAAAARAAGQLEDARVRLEQARRIDPDEPTSQVALGGVLLDERRTAAAEAEFRAVLARAPGNVDALRGVVAALTADGRAAEALRFIDGLPPEQAARIDVRQLRAERAAADGRAALTAGDLPGAEQRFEEAVALAPDDAWIRLDLARLQLRRGAPEQARATLAALLDASPPPPAALYVNALLQADQKDWPAAYTLLERIPAADRTADMAALLLRAAVGVDTTGALVAAREGRREEAAARLDRAVSRLDDGSPADLYGQVAQTAVDIGDLTRARALLRSVIARPDADAGLRLQYGGLLLRGGEDVELAGLLRDIPPTGLTEGDRRSYEGLRRGLALRQVEALRERGELAAAYEWLAPMLAAEPDDPALLGALARLYTAAGQPDTAARLYRTALQRSPDDVGLLLSLGILATGQRDDVLAEQALRAAQRIEPGNPDVLAALGRLARIQGRKGEAVTLLKAALSATAAPADTASSGAAWPAAPGGMPSVAVPGANPFAGYRPSAAGVPLPAAAPFAPQRPRTGG
ncbi:tetratricopeptide repeat protein [uncultured Xylophilus sp.]|uniref:tetratricopeptide repeat protein n=1 Tax=uncultured Xylophilus sp. TaxID=296832 RepID=UPI0025CD82E7|nr:tetratricopeptide repeat protein [uncultured Xylophilus sp.]